MRFCISISCAAFLLVTTAFAQEKDPADQLKMKDVSERLNAVSRIIDQGHPKQAALLKKACSDNDWEVVEKATIGLAKRGDDKSLKTLAKLAVSGPLATIRVAAATSLRALDKEAAIKLLVKKLKGKTIAHAAEALVSVGYPAGWKRFKKLTKSEFPLLRQGGIRGLAATGDPRAAKELSQFLRKDPDVTARAAAANALAVCGTDEALSILLERLAQKGVRPVMARRISEAICTIAANREEKQKETAIKMCLDAYKKGGRDTQSHGFLARLMGQLGNKESNIADAERCAACLIEFGKGRPQGSIVSSLGSLGGAESFAYIQEIATSDSEPKTRLLAIRAAVMTEDKAAPDLIAKVLADDSSDIVKEEAATLCGQFVHKATSKAAREALSDVSWPVVLAAAVSLGKIQDAQAIPLLVTHLENDNYLMRASAAAGLGRIARKATVLPLIGALDDKDNLVRDTALDYLQRMTGQRLSANSKKWLKWWKTGSEGFKFVDQVALRNRETQVDAKYDRFSENPYGSFKNVRVIVLGQSRDKMEDSLEVLGIKHVMTQTGKVFESGLHPNAVFFANCPGVITNDDSQRLSWFVRSGGYMFATCVAVSNTVMKTFPEMIKRAPASANPPGPVDSFPVESQSPFLRGVFGRHVRLRFQVAGNQLPVPADNDRVHVLVDSTDACSRWGSGAMASWFKIGHGVVVDSANHFVLQGFANERMKTADERRSYAIERLGIKFREIRKLDKKKVFSSQSKAAKACHDRTMMRLVARFVYDRRRDH